MTTRQVVKTSVTVNNSQSSSGLQCPSQSYSTCLSSNTDGCSMLDALYLLVWRCSHILTDSKPANSVGWCRLHQSSVRLSYWSGDDSNYVTIIVGWCWTHMLVDNKLKHRLSPSSSNIVTTAYSTQPSASLIGATKGSQCWYSIAQVRYIEILTRLRGLLVIFLYLVSLCSSLFWELRDSGVVKNLQFCP